MPVEPPNETTVRAGAWIFVILAFLLSAGRAFLFTIRHRKPPVARPRNARERIFGAAFGGVSLVAFGVTIARGAGSDWYNLTIPWRAAESAAIAMAACILIIFGFLFAFYCQARMGASWRIGVPGEPTKLVTSGPYKYIRNPIYTGFLAAETGLVFLLPSVASAVVLAVSIITILEWTRVEELQQLEMHGAEYKQYRAATGRFFPRLRRANSE